MKKSCYKIFCDYLIMIPVQLEALGQRAATVQMVRMVLCKTMDSWNCSRCVRIEDI